MSCVRPPTHPPVRPFIHHAWQNLNVEHYIQTVQPFFISALFIDSFGGYHFTPLSLTLTLPGGHKVSAKQTLLDLYVHKYILFSVYVCVCVSGAPNLPPSLAFCISLSVCLSATLMSTSNFHWVIVSFSPAVPVRPFMLASLSSPLSSELRWTIGYIIML